MHIYVWIYIDIPNVRAHSKHATDATFRSTEPEALDLDKTWTGPGKDQDRTRTGPGQDQDWTRTGPGPGQDLERTWTGPGLCS